MENLPDSRDMWLRYSQKSKHLDPMTELIGNGDAGTCKEENSKAKKD